MTATDTFYRAVMQQNLPVAVPVETPEAEGLAATQFDIRQNQDAVDVVFSSDWRDRAIAAVYACRAAHEAVERDLAHS